MPKTTFIPPRDPFEQFANLDAARDEYRKASDTITLRRWAVERAIEVAQIRGGNFDVVALAGHIERFVSGAQHPLEAAAKATSHEPGYWEKQVRATQDEQRANWTGDDA